MATNSKPSTGFYINYGALSPTVAQRALAPALIAPRYRLHRTADGYASAELTEFPVAKPTAVFAWPDKLEDSVVDVSSAKLIARNLYLDMNNTPLSAVVGTNATNFIKTAKTVKYVGETLAPELDGYEVKAGDKAKITVDGSEVTCTVVDIQPTMTAASITKTAVDSAPTAGIVTGGAFTGSRDVAYLVKAVVAEASDSESESTSSEAVLVVDVTALDGDYGYSARLTLGEAAVALGNYGITLTKGSATVADGDSYIVYGKAPVVDKYDLVYVDVELGNAGSSADVVFCSAALSPVETALASAYWTANTSGITVSQNINVTLGGKTYAVASADLYAQYRELRTDDILELRTNQTTSIADWVGFADPENPMGMMYAAAQQITGTFFYLLAVDDTEAGAIEGINYVGQFEGAYAPISYLQTAATQNAIASVIAKYADPSIAQFKHTWFAPVEGRDTVIYDKDDSGNALLGSVSATGNLTITGTNVNVISKGVKAGDVVVIVGGFDAGSGTLSESEYKIVRVAGPTTVELANAGLIGVSRIYIKRVLSGSEYAAKLAETAASINNSRINFVGCDTLTFLGFSDVDPVYLCAALASMRCALPPHAPLNDLAVPGFTVGNTLRWTDTDYETMNAGGVWVVARDSSGAAVTFHQITTRTDGTIAEEDSAVSNGDAIVRRLRIAVSPYASGRSNVTTQLLDRLETALYAELNQISATVYDAIYGSQILDYSITSLTIPEGNKQSVICNADISLPLPLQDGRFYFNLF